MIGSLQGRGRRALTACSWQGGWEDDEDVYQAASREAMEEAGVKGVINVCHQCLPASPLLIHLLIWHHAQLLPLNSLQCSYSQ